MQEPQQNREEKVRKRRLKNTKVQDKESFQKKDKDKSKTRDEGHTKEGKQTGHSISNLLIWEKVCRSELKSR